jgi:hypothetical protein
MYNKQYQIFWLAIRPTKGVGNFFNAPSLAV